MRISVREREGVTVLEVRGKITIGEGDIALREAVGDCVRTGAQNILLDLAGVTTIDSSGIGEVVSAYTTVTNQGGNLKLCNLSAKVSDILQITQLITVFDVYDDEDEAVASF